VKQNIARLAALIVVATCLGCGSSLVAAQEPTIKIDITKSNLGVPPADFEFARTGDGDLGLWTVVRDATAEDGVAIEHVSTDQHDDRFPLAIYRPVTVENVEVSVRFKVISGTLKSAGLALCLRNPGNYYVVSASALEHRIDLFLIMNGKIQRIESAEAEVALDHWHSLRVTVNDDHFVVSLDNNILFTAFERTRMKDGHVALWTQEDNVSRFDRIEIQPLPNPEAR
jgi:Galactocerebrosidase, C-terminal lectin domain